MSDFLDDVTGVETTTSFDENAYEQINSETLFEDEELFYSAEYCINHCAFHKTCYANHSICIKQIINEILKTLSPREMNVIKLACGYNGVKMTSEDIAAKYSRTPERIEQIKAKAFRKLRHPSRSKKLKPFIYDVFTVSENDFYASLLSGIFGINPSELPDVRLGIDFDVIHSGEMSQKSPSEIKTELECPIEKIEVLNPYLDKVSILNITSLNHLLHTSRVDLLLKAFNLDDVSFFDMVNCVNKKGYRFKDAFLNSVIEDLFTEKLIPLVIDESVLSQSLLDLPLNIVLKLMDLNIGTIEDLINQIQGLKASKKISNDEIVRIEQFLKDKKVIFEISDTSVEYLSKEKTEIFIKQLIDWMIRNRHSIFTLIERLKPNDCAPLENLEYIFKQYPEFFESILVNVKRDIDYEATIEELDLSVRAFNCLKCAGVDTVADLVELSEDDLRARNRNIGYKVIKEIQDTLLRHGVYFKEDSTKARFDSNFLPVFGKEHIYMRLENQGIFNSIPVDSICAIIRDEEAGKTTLFGVTDEAVVEYWYYDVADDWVIAKSEIETFCKEIMEGSQWDSIPLNSQKRLLVKNPIFNAFFEKLGDFLEEGLCYFLQRNMESLNQLSIDKTFRRAH